MKAKLSPCLALLVLFLSAATVCAQSVSLRWDANSEADLAGYRIHYGLVRGSYTAVVDVGRVTTCTISNLTAGRTYYFAATAYSSAGLSSGYSSEVSYTVPLPNTSPGTPALTAGPTSGAVNTACSYTASAVDPDGDPLQYRFDWGDGSVSAWGQATQTHSWSAAGQFSVKAQAMDGRGAASAWSAARAVAISAPAPAPAAPPAPSTDPDKEAAGPPATGGGSGALPVEAPLLAAPVDEAVVDSAPELQTGPFRSAVGSARHVATRWQIFREEDELCVFDLQSASALTRLRVPRLVLEEDTPYFWRARFVASDGSASEWSDYGYFTTRATGLDLNANGIPDAQEVSVPTDLDMNGVDDRRQATIKVIASENPAGLIGVGIRKSPNAVAIEAVALEPAEPAAIRMGDQTAQPEYGLIHFRVAVARPGDATNVKIFFPEPVPRKAKWLKYDPVADAWSDFAPHARFTSNRRSVVLELQDGGVGDADGVENGVIVDPSALVVLEKSRRR